MRICLSVGPRIDHRVRDPLDPPRQLLNVRFLTTHRELRMNLELNDNPVCVALLLLLLLLYLFINNVVAVAGAVVVIHDAAVCVVVVYNVVLFSW